VRWAMLLGVGTCQKRSDLPPLGKPPARTAGPIEVALGLSNAALVRALLRLLAGARARRHRRHGFPQCDRRQKSLYKPEICLWAAIIYFAHHPMRPRT
jgi:hypothetical protein